MNTLDLLRQWEQWEADIITDDKAWPGNEMTINGSHYDKMLELQIKRNEAIKYLTAPDPICGRCQLPLSRCKCAY